MQIATRRDNFANNVKMMSGAMRYDYGVDDNSILSHFIDGFADR